MKRIIVFIITAVIAMSIVSVVEVPQTVIGAENKNTNKQDEEMLKKQVLQFLSTWLIDRDYVKAIDSFGTRAFSNEAIFAAECFDIGDAARNSADAMKKQIMLLLEETNYLPPFGDLNAALNTESFLLFKSLKSKAINQIEQDKFLLVPVKASYVANLTPKSKKKSREFLKDYYKSSRLYLLIVSFGNDYDGGIMYFVWEKDGDDWNISHVSIPFCM